MPRFSTAYNHVVFILLMVLMVVFGGLVITLKPRNYLTYGTSLNYSETLQLDYDFKNAVSVTPTGIDVTVIPDDEINPTENPTNPGSQEGGINTPVTPTTSSPTTTPSNLPGPTVTNAPQSSPTAMLKTYIANNSRQAIRRWSMEQSISQTRTTLQQLSSDEFHTLVTLATNTTATGTKRNNLIEYYKQILSVPELAFYLEVFARTMVDTYEGGGGGYSTGPTVVIGDGILETSTWIDGRNTIAHELFHSFNYFHNGPQGRAGLNEGTAIYIFKQYLPGSTDFEQSLGLAEPTFGTMNFYRDVNADPMDLCMPYGIPPTSMDAKAQEVFNMLKADDQSHLPIHDYNKLNACYKKYFNDLNRNQDFNDWLIEFEQQHTLMVQELQSTGTCTLPPGFTNTNNLCPTIDP